MKNINYFFFLIIFHFTFVSAQQDAQFSAYNYYGLYINPAYAGSHDMFSAAAVYRRQWLKIPGAPQTASLAVHSTLKNDKIALGFTYTFDGIGVTKTNSLNGNFAYRIFVDKKKTIRLSFGLSAGVVNYRQDLNRVATTEPDDLNFVGNSQNRWLPNVGFGIYTYSPKFFVAISMPHILANRLNGKSSLFETSSVIAHQYHHVLITGGYIFNLGKKVKFLPSTLIKIVPGHAPVTFDFNATFIFLERLRLGAAYRLNDSYNFLLAVNITKQLLLGYVYDLTVSPLSHYTSGSHEVILTFDFDITKRKNLKEQSIKYF